MKLRLEEISKGQEEVIVRYRQMNATVQAICELVQEDPQKLLVETDLGSQYVLVDDLFYFESIDGKTFAYTEDSVYQVHHSLKDLVQAYQDRGFFRAAKSLVLNLYRIAQFKSQSFGRIEATLDNGEKVIISRKYAAKLRQLLKEGVADED